MIRKLMGSSAILALVTAGAMNIAQAQTSPATTEQPAAQAPAAAAEQPAAATANQPTGELPDSASNLTPDQPTLASAFMGQPVYSNEGQDAANIGEINDLIVSSDGSITHAVIGVGGFLGIGEKDVAVPFDELQVVEQEGNIRLTYSASREQLEQAQAFDRSMYEPEGRAQQEMAQTNADGTTDVSAAGQPVTGTTTLPAAGATATQPTDTAAATQPADTASSDQFMAFNANDQIRASTLLGKEVYGTDNESIGEVGDLVLQPDGNTRSAIVDVGGFLGVGEKSVAIPFDQIQMMQDGNEPRLTVAMTKDQLNSAPAYVSPDEQAAEQQANANQQGGATTTGQPMSGTTDPNAQMASGQTGSTNQPMGGAADPNAQAAVGQTNPDMQFVAATQDLSADTLIGGAVVSNDDRALGEVNDVVFNPDGEIQAVVVDVGGFLGIGEKPVAVTFDQLNVQKNDMGDVRLKIDATQEQLQAAPAYQNTAK